MKGGYNLKKNLDMRWLSLCIIRDQKQVYFCTEAKTPRKAELFYNYSIIFTYAKS